MANQSNTRVTVVIPTMKRNEPLKRALGSILSQVPPEGVQLDVIVVDNSPDARARPVINEMAGNGVPIRYISEENAGVANARNAGVRAAEGDYVAFLDDDEEANPDWIMCMLKCALSSKADAIFGPVHAKADDGADIGPFAPYFSRSFDHENHADVTSHAAYMGTNNSMFLRRHCFTETLPFDQRLNEYGAEDTLFLQNLVSRGCRFAWCSGGLVTEWVPASRLNWSYVRNRKFFSGQSRSFVLAMHNPPRRLRIAFWMMAGAAQATVYGLATLLMYWVDTERAEAYRVRAYGGLGKVLWMKRFRPALYGAHLVS